MNDPNSRNYFEKPWGNFQRIFQSDSCHVDRCEIQLGGLSSHGNWHRHNYKFNKIYVESGQLILWCESKKNKHKWILGDDCESRSVTIYPNNRHRFEAITDCIVWEVYWSICNTQDLHRYSEQSK